MENENLILQIRDLHFQYPASDFKIEISDIKITQGSKIAISGKSGSGKTTLIHLISGILKPQSGEILFYDKSITDMNDKEIRKHRISNIGFIFQEFELLEYLNVMDNLILPYKINKSLVLDAEIKDKAKEIANRIGIGNKLDQHPKQLSGGERQRLAIARALITSPPLIIADEPTGNLDEKTSNIVMDEITDQVSYTNSTLIMISHNNELISSFDEIIDIQESPNIITQP
ncbi:MAG: ABC transporter ATP-binding protein [Verrucomicrobiales bacterium]|nr:ABC transporter ATP-binding protein [Verrucomicrobiales bacterium]MED5259004.1 ABC transporter ATP-binding protein [Verrucomicrobiota bacterium]|tara:strand:- start:1683 stop:2372 length:690 start_codon:yes stop_codon:yes gene_type:complete